jgi:hypothetical protein
VHLEEQLPLRAHRLRRAGLRVSGPTAADPFCRCMRHLVSRRFSRYNRHPILGTLPLTEAGDWCALCAGRDGNRSAAHIEKVHHQWEKPCR